MRREHGELWRRSRWWFSWSCENWEKLSQDMIGTPQLEMSKEMWGWKNTKVHMWWEVSKRQAKASWAAAMVDTSMPSIDTSQVPQSCVRHLST